MHFAIIAAYLRLLLVTWIVVMLIVLAALGIAGAFRPLASLLASRVVI
jgi:hypothetical protein